MSSARLPNWLSAGSLRPRKQQPWQHISSRGKRLGSTKPHWEFRICLDRWARALDYTTTSALLVEALVVG
jgi:hypothetical protein